MSTTRVEAQAARDLAKLRAAMGPSDAVDHFIHCYSKVRVQKIYAFHLRHYLHWLAEKKGVRMTPDELVADNLRSIYKSEPEDVVSKMKHMSIPIEHSLLAWSLPWCFGDLFSPSSPPY